MPVNVMCAPFVFPGGSGYDSGIFGPLLEIKGGGEFCRPFHSPAEIGSDEWEEKFGISDTYFSSELGIMVVDKFAEIS